MKVIIQICWTISLCCVLLPYITYAKDVCPPKDFILPCTCELDQDIKWGSIKCSNISVMETLVDVFDRSGDRRFKLFTLVDSSLMYLPSCSLKTKRFMAMRIENVTLTSLFDRVPSAANDLEALVLSHVSFQRGIRWDLFENLSKLKALQIVSTEVKRLEKSFMQNIGKNITILYLNDTKTKQLNDHVFENLTMLTDLQFINSKIKFLKRSMFSRPAAIRNFMFGQNWIESLPEDIFSDMPSLRVISLHNNKLSTFTESIFEGTYDQLFFLDIENNPINCDCSIQWFIPKGKKHLVAGTCEMPMDKSGRRLRDIVESDLDYCRDTPPRGINSLLDTLHL